MNDVLDKVWSKIVGGMDWLKAVIYGEFDDDRPISAIVADMLVSFVPGVIIVTSARDLTAVIIRLVRHPDKRDDVHEWMLIVACAIPLVLPVLAAAVGAAAAGVGAVVGGIAGSEAGAALRAVALMLIEKGGYMLAEVVGFLRRFVKGDVMAVLKDIKFAKYGGALVQYVGKFITKMRSLIRKLIEALRGYTWVSGVEDMIGKLNRLEREFYAVQTKAVGEIPKALAELDARLAKLLEQTPPKEEHLAYAGVAPAEVKPIQHEPVRMAAMPNNPLGVPEGVSKTPPTYERVPESPNVHPDKTAKVKISNRELLEEQLSDAVSTEAHALSTKGSPRYLSNSQRGPVLSGVMDPQTGEIFYGLNQGRVPTDLHPLLQQRLDSYLERTNGATPVRAGIPGSHSEITALDQAIKAREARFGTTATEADISDFLLHNRSLIGERRAIGIPPRCPNCAVITDGINVVGGN